MTSKGAIVAAAVAGLFAAGAPLIASAKDGGTVKCSGANDCKGKGGCKSAENECKGKNGCKGKGGPADMTEADCTKKGGKVVAAGGK